MCTVTCLVEPHVLKKISEKFSSLLKTSRTYKTPGTPAFNIVKASEQNLISEEEQALFRSGGRQLIVFGKAV